MHHLKLSNYYTNIASLLNLKNDIHHNQCPQSPVGHHLKITLIENGFQD